MLPHLTHIERPDMKMQIVSSKKYHDLGAFPLDPMDCSYLEASMRPEGINFYVRIFDPRRSPKTIIMIDNYHSVNNMWDFAKRKKFTPKIHMNLVTHVHDFFVKGTATDVEAVKFSAKMLCLQHLPALRNLKQVPKENIVGMILEFKANAVFSEYCYCQFDYNAIPEMTVTKH
jgi:hypothetical protein